MPLYAFTALVPLERIHNRRHFFSDVVGGSILGLVAGRAVQRQREKEERSWSWQALQSPSHGELRLRWSF